MLPSHRSPDSATHDRIRKMTMDAMPQTAVQNENLHTCSIIVDDAQDFSPMLLDAGRDDTLISESMIPQIRTVAALIAAERHDFSRSSPAEFTDAADFFLPHGFSYWACDASIWTYRCFRF